MLFLFIATDCCSNASSMGSVVEEVDERHRHGSQIDRPIFLCVLVMGYFGGRGATESSCSDLGSPGLIQEANSRSEAVASNKVRQLGPRSRWELLLHLHLLFFLIS